MKPLSISEELQSLIKEMRRRIPDLLYSAVISADGLVIVADLPPEVDEDLFAATQAALISVSERVVGEVGIGPLSEIVVAGGKGRVVAMQAGPEAILVSVVPADVKLGLLLVEMRRLAKEIASRF